MERWVDITTISSPNEEQFEVYSGKTRHRPKRLGNLHPFEEKGWGQWTTVLPANLPPNIDKGDTKC